MAAQCTSLGRRQPSQGQASRLTLPTRYVKQIIVSFSLTCHRPYPNHSVPVLVDHVDNRSASTNMGDGLGPGMTSDLYSFPTPPICTSERFWNLPWCIVSMYVSLPQHNTTLHHTSDHAPQHKPIQHYYTHTTTTATNTHLPHLAMLMMPVMSSTPTCSDLLVHFPSPPLGD